MEVKTSNSIKEILIKLAKIQSDIDYLKEHVKDEDLFLTEDEENLLKDSYVNEKKGKLISSKKIREKLEI